MTTYYETGTVSIGAGSTTLTGVGTAWTTAGLLPGDVLVLSGLSVPVLTVNSATQITLARPWPGAPQSGANYAIFPQVVQQRALTAFNQMLQQLGANGNLTSIAALTTAADRLPFYTGAGTAALATFTAFARTLLDDADAATARATLGLGTAAIHALTTSAADATANRVLKVGDYGLGGIMPIIGNASVTDNSIVPGHYTYSDVSAGGSSSGGPAAVTRATLYHRRRSPSGGETQLLIADVPAGQVWVRARETGGWSAWRRLYDQAAVLGGVAQSGGLPTGALIERGSNANGEFVRLADGTQICAHAVTASLALDQPLLGGFRSAAQTWTYPAGFAVAPALMVTARNLTAFGGVSANVPGTASAQYALTAVATQAAAPREVGLMAVGRWF